MTSEIDRIEREFPENRIDEISDEYSTKVNEAFNEFFKNNSEDELCQSIIHFANEIQRMIFHIDGRINYWEDRRTQFLQIGAAILAASIVGIVSLFPEVPDSFSSSDSLSIKAIVMIPTVTASVVLFFGSIRIIDLWNRQNNPNYPFTKGVRVWRWHYRHAETEPVSTDVDTYNETIFKEQARIFAKNSADYKVKNLTSSTRDLLDQDLSQLFLLLTNEKFKIKFVNKLRDKLLMTLRWASISALATFVITLILYFLLR